MTIDYSSETAEDSWKRHNIFKVLEEKNCQLRILYSTKLSFRCKGQIDTLDEGEQEKRLPADML